MIALHDIERVAEHLAKAVNAEQVILFGSYARGDAKNDSDVDFLIIVPSNLPRFKRSRELYALFRPYPFAMDLVVYTPQEIENGRRSPASFVSIVLREGKVLYDHGKSEGI
ncbi:DNA polymerase, beta domain protein region [Candidatus Moduliflexus flocculans]|uniref:DNA polymerase, beta domain protein region n=1 Tax=Candidatus Moduliflexus flocculans TaxID=1499966 RepID=A0A081BS21_9BACT|nr:DNA polymerase, beta domain protein region [Candidatus Moduliflexus flocculans]